MLRNALPRLDLPSQTAAVVLAAGESRRMGLPKALARVGNETFLGRILDLYRLLEVPCCVVLGREAAKISSCVDLQGCHVLVNPRPENGPLSSFLLALRHASASSAALLHPVDHPLVPPTVVEALLATHRRHPSCMIIPVFAGRRGHPALFPSRFYPDLHSAPLDEGARWAVKRHLHSTITLPVGDSAVLANLNDPEDLRRWGIRA